MAHIHVSFSSAPFRWLDFRDAENVFCTHDRLGWVAQLNLTHWMTCRIDMVVSILSPLSYTEINLDLAKFLLEVCMIWKIII
jgi:hypothetical protein